MNIYHDLKQIIELAKHNAKAHNCNYNIILHNPVNGEFGEGSTYEFVTDSYFDKDRPNAIILHKTDDLLNKVAVIVGERQMGKTAMMMANLKPDTLIVGDYEELGKAAKFKEFYRDRSIFGVPYKVAFKCTAEWLEENGINTYEKLKREYELIQDKKSSLSRNSREAVVKVYEQLYK